MTKKTLAAFVLVVALSSAVFAQNISLLNVSYDPTRELYQDYNQPSRNIGKPRPARQSRWSSRMEARASRREASSTGCRRT